MSVCGQITGGLQSAEAGTRQKCSQVSSQVQQTTHQVQRQCHQVTSQVCGQLPWPLSSLCKAVTSLVCTVATVTLTVVATIVTTVCRMVVVFTQALQVIVAVVCRPLTVLVAIFSGMVEQGPSLPHDPPDLGGARFPGDFLWGVATASFQVEGRDDERTDRTDWDVFATSDWFQLQTTILAGLASAGGDDLHVHLRAPGLADNHWDLDQFAADLERAVALGMTAYRLSVEWSRIQPSRPGSADPAAWQPGVDWDPEALARYGRMLDLIHEKGLRVVLTLSHITLPSWILMPGSGDLPGNSLAAFPSLDGWVGDQTVAHFVGFVRLVASHLGDRVDLWVTVNEPVGSVAALGYVAGVWSPGLSGHGDLALAVVHNLIDAHCRAYDTIKEVVGSNARVGFAHAVLFTRPEDPGSSWLNQLGQAVLGSNADAEQQFRYATVYAFLDAVVNGASNPGLQRGAEAGFRKDWAGRCDFIGVNYYRAADIHHDNLVAVAAPWLGGSFFNDVRTKHPDFLWNDLGWTIAPGGLYEVLSDLHARYQRPLLVTENGIAERPDRNRAPYVVAHLQQALRAVRDGMPLMGYLHWSLVDNWEWSSDYAPEASFGLFTVDGLGDATRTDSARLPRHLTEGALALAQVIAVSARLAATDPSGAPPTPDDPLGLPSACFGTITPDGTSFVPPTRSWGRTWELTLGTGAAPTHVLHLLPVHPPIWQVFLFDLASGGWSTGLGGVDSTGSSPPSLTFDVGERTWVGAVTGTEPGSDLSGTVGGIPWQATAVRRAGTWTEPSGSFVTLTDLEGSGLTGKRLDGATPPTFRMWAPADPRPLVAGTLAADGTSLTATDGTVWERLPDGML